MDTSMDTTNETDFEFILTKTVAELKDICRVNSVCGFSRLRKNELCDLLITYYKKNIYISFFQKLDMCLRLSIFNYF